MTHSHGCLSGPFAFQSLCYYNQHHAIDLSTPPSCANFLGLIYGLLAAAALWFSADRLPTRVNLYIVRFIAVACCLSALLDIRNDLFTFAPASGTFVNDAVALSRLTGLSSLVWANVWLIVSMWVLATFLTSALRGAD